MLLTSILKNSSEKYADLPALSMRMGYRTVTLTYRHVNERAHKVAQYFHEQGLVKGDRVLICAHNSPDWICVFWACMLRGYQLVPLAPQSTQSLVDTIAQQTQAKMFVKSASIRIVVNSISTIIIEQIEELITQKSMNVAAADLDEHDVAEIMFTSGTTGDPKGVMLTHRNIMSNVMALQESFNFSGPQECLLSILPLSHMLEQATDFLLAFSMGAHVVYAHSHGAIIELMNQYHVTKIAAVPEFLKVLAQRIQGQIKERKLDRFFRVMQWCANKIPSMRLRRIIFWPILRKFGGRLDTIASGGSALDPELERFWNTLGISILQGYGLTETSPVITLNSYHKHRLGSVGKPLCNVHVRLGSDGEIEVRGPNVFSGYYKNEAKTKECFTADGWFKTGDMGYFDSDGFLYLKGRRKYMIKGAGAQNIFPEDIEMVLNEFAGVADSCVVGIEKHGGLDIYAVVLASDPTLDLEKTVLQANEKLLPYQHITGWALWPESDFPRSAIQKVKKELVIEWIKNKNHTTIKSQEAIVNPFVKMLSIITGIDPSHILPTTKLVTDLKLDSLMRVELVTRIEELRGVAIDERLITPTTTVVDLETIVATSKPLKKMPKVSRWQRSLVAGLLRKAGHIVSNLILRLFFTIKVEGLENIKDINNPIMYMPNHVSLLDGALVLFALPRKLRARVSFAAAYDVLYGQYWYARPFIELFFNSFPFPRQETEHVASGLLNVGTMLDDGYSVVLFPEGKLSPDGLLQPLKRGAGLLIVEMGVPIIPIILEGVQKLVPYDCLVPRQRGMITIKIGRPITFSKMTRYDDALAAITKALQELHGGNCLKQTD